VGHLTLNMVQFERQHLMQRWEGGGGTTEAEMAPILYWGHLLTTSMEHICPSTPPRPPAPMYTTTFIHTAFPYNMVIPCTTCHG
jgi:hypothetical protein